MIMNNIISTIKKPTLILDNNKLRINIKKMVTKAEKSNVKLRPHFKTHQSKEIGMIFKECGIKSITVSSLDMARYFSESGWDDITVAIPVNIRQIDEISYLTEKISLGILIDSLYSILYLKNHLDEKTNLKIWIEIDTGDRRTGIESSNVELIKKIVIIILESNKFTLGGLITHAGHTYNSKSKVEVISLFKDSIAEMKLVKEYLQNYLNIEPIISVGDTPSCSIIDKFDCNIIDEIRPGNFVFYDLTQVKLQSCIEEDISIAVACPVIGKNREKNEIIIYGGTVHLSKEYVKINGNKVYGLVSLSNSNSSWRNSLKNTYVSKTSQEHGIINIDPSYIDQINIGDLVFILPVHSCITANLFSKYLLFTNETYTSFRSLE